MSMILLALALCVGGALCFLVFALLYVSKTADDGVPQLMPSGKLPTGLYSGRSKGNPR